MATLELTAENFETTINENPNVIIDFWAPWCAPCRGFAPSFEAASEKHTDFVFAKVNTEEQPNIAAAFNIRSIPTLMIFRDQIVIFSEAGAPPADAFHHLLDQALALDMDTVRKEIAEEQPAAPRG
ncbi:MAG: thioredoxin [Betaproteobacteria bacterium HGW-Betaproteobacteria-11]|nr:MAG: thioredoxin [Betaproteobacteria bacterium HGW-Betaproteobacteria-11]